MTLPRHPLIVVLTSLGLLLPGAVAQAATVSVGEQVLTPSSGLPTALGQNVPAFQGDASGNYVLAAPQSGTITSWSFLSGGIPAGRHFVLRVLTLADAPTGTWRAVATSAPVAVTTATGVDAVNGPFPASIAIAAGSRIALQPTDGIDTPVEGGTFGADGIRYFTAPFADGSTAPLAPGSTADNGQVVPVQATVDVSGGNPPPPPTPPVNQQPPHIDGTPAAAGRALGCNPGTWSNGPLVFAYQWSVTQRVRLPSGLVTDQTTPLATTRPLTTPDLPAGATLSCTVTATNTTTGAAASAPAAPVTVVATIPVLGGATSLHGTSSPQVTVSVGAGARRLTRVSTCSTGSWLHHPTTYRYDWYALTTATAGPSASARIAGGPTLTLSAATEGRYLLCRVTASNAAGAATALSNRLFVSQADLGVHVNAMELTQGVQTPELPTRGQDPAQNHLSYSGVMLPWEQGIPNAQPVTALLVDGHKTVVRVYVNTDLPVTGNPLPTVVLRAYRGGRLLAPGPISPDQPPPAGAVPVGPLGVVDATQRYDPRGAYTFTVPWAWTAGDVTFRAEALQPTAAAGVLGRARICATCDEERTLSLGPEHFNATTAVHIDQVPFAVKPSSGTLLPFNDPGPDSAWAATQAASAFPLLIYPQPTELDGSAYINAASITVQTCDPFCSSKSTPRTADLPANDPQGLQPFYHLQAAKILSQVEDWANAHDTLSSHYPFGVIPPNGGNFGGGITNNTNGRILFGSDQPRSISLDNRPVDGMAHELDHGIGLQHNDTTCGGQLGVNGGSEPWPPTNDGELDGVGLDTLQPSPYTIVHSQGIATFTTPADKKYDLMSYCGGTGAYGGHWISVRNWNRQVAFRAPGAVFARAARRASSAASYRTALAADPATAAGLAVTAVLDPALHRTVITAVQPDPGPPTPVGASDGYTLVGRDATGAIVARAGATGSFEHIDHSTPVTLITGRIAAAGVREIDILQGSAPIALDHASAHAPTVTLRSPRAGATVGGARSVAIRWSAADADGDARTAVVRYSPDGGRTWRTAYTGADAGGATLPSHLLGASRDARVRVAISDGFDTAVATSGRFTALGAPPVVTVTSPTAGTRVADAGALDLAGGAFDDAGRALTGRALTWTLGPQVLGHGAAITAAGLPAGRRRIVLSARDRTGRTSTAAVTVTVTATAPAITSLRVPARLSRRARALTLRIGTLAGATLVAGRVRVAVGPVPRTLRLPVRPGAGTLRLVLTLRSGRFSVRVPVTVARR